MGEAPLSRGRLEEDRAGPLSPLVRQGRGRINVEASGVVEFELEFAMGDGRCL